jgi:DNA primase large subunit
LSLDESLQLWKSKFSAKKTLDQFDKQYAYNIRHNYGQEGKRTDYPPWSCNKIQNLPPPNSTEMHGCPFKVFSEDKLRNILYEMKFKEGDVIKILDKKKSNEFSVACIRFFEARYPNNEFEKVGIHPNYYFASAAGKLKKRGKENKVQIKEEHVDV